jgi:hypothetical protein
LSKSPSPISIEIEYEEGGEKDRNGNPYKRATALYTEEDIIV